MKSKLIAKGMLSFLLICSMFISLLSASSAAESAQNPETVRVLLDKQTKSMSFKTNGDYQLINSTNGKVITKLSDKESWQVELQAGQITFQSTEKEYGPFSGPVWVQETSAGVSVLAAPNNVVEGSSASGLTVLSGSGEIAGLAESTGIYVRDAQGKKELSMSSSGLNLVSLQRGTEYKRYRGNMVFSVENGELLAINELHVEDYLRGVVPAEMPSSWPAEALKAQAVVARNYALQSVAQTDRGVSRYDLTSDQYNQVYSGYDSEGAATNQAVEATAGVVMLNKGDLILAFFHSSSGGYTENSEDVWKNALPYIKTKEDPYDQNNAHYDWQVNYTTNQLQEKLKAAGYDFMSITDVETTYTASGVRVKKMTISGVGVDNKPLLAEIANADSVRITLGLKSSLFTLQEVYDSNKDKASDSDKTSDKASDKDKKLAGVSISGSGWGHGLGLSQWGANGMAKQGYKYEDILQYYYTDIAIIDNYGRP